MNHWITKLTVLAVLATTLSVVGCASKQTGDSKWSLANLLNTNTPSDTLNARIEDDDYDVFGERSPDRVMLADLGPGRIGTTVKTRLFGSGGRPEAEAAFEKAQTLYAEAIQRWERDEKDGATTSLFRRAAQKFELAADAWRNSTMEQDALFMEGESHFFANDYLLANRAYELLLTRYSGTTKLDLVESRRFEIAQYWLALSRKKDSFGLDFAFGSSGRPLSDLAGQARRILHRIRLDDPTGKLSDDATLALANAFFEAERYADAADAYEDLRTTYPGSPHQFHAHLFELRARLANYRGADYDGTDLEKAEDLMKRIVRQFPTDVEKERDFLISEGQRMRELMAERDWAMGAYYESRGENRAAKHYYAKVAESFDDTAFGERARERVVALKGAPPVPVQQAQWLVSLFPEKEINKPLVASDDQESIFR